MIFFLEGIGGCFGHPGHPWLHPCKPNHIANPTTSPNPIANHNYNRNTEKLIMPSTLISGGHKAMMLSDVCLSVCRVHRA